MRDCRNLRCWVGLSVSASETGLDHGRGGGIGLVMARAFAEAGDRVWVTDVASEPGMAALFAEIAAEWGGLDVLCANAGIKGPTAAIEDMPLDGLHQCLAVNLDGAMLAAKYGARLMKPVGRGVMIFTSSTSGLCGTWFRALYVAAKWAVIGLMKTVAMELGPYGIRANAICPGSVNGERIDRVLEAEAAAKGMTVEAVRDGYASGTALKQLSEPKDVAALALFLASDGARMITGQTLAVDGMTYNVDP